MSAALTSVWLAGQCPLKGVWSLMPTFTKGGKGRWGHGPQPEREVTLAARLPAETTTTVGWIAERLGMGGRDSEPPAVSSKKIWPEIAIIKNRPQNEDPTPLSPRRKPPKRSLRRKD